MNPRDVFEQKRSVVIEVLQGLVWVWDLAEWFLIIVQSSYVEEWLLDLLIDTLQKSIDATTSASKQQNLQSALHQIQALRQAEQQSRQQDEIDAENMMATIEKL